jgi:hypothetical protein
MKKNIGIIGTSKSSNVDSKTKLTDYQKLNDGPVKFKSLGEMETFMRLTQIIPQKKVLQLKLKTMNQCLDEYNLIMEKKSKLTSAERTQVKNIIHQQVRLGKIILTIG